MDDLKAKLAEDELLQAQVLDILKGTNVGKAYAETIAKNYFEENISQEHKKIYDFVDNALTSVGLEKPSGVKTSDWAKMIAEQNKELSDKLEKEGYIFSPYDNWAEIVKQSNILKNASQLIGVTKPYGMMVLNKSFINENWNKYDLEVVDIIEGIITTRQDLVVLRKK